MAISKAVLEAWETHRVALNRELYNEGVGLPYDSGELDRQGSALGRLAEEMLRTAEGDAERWFALEAWVEARQVPLDEKLRHEQDAYLLVPHLLTGQEPLAWRNWKRFERENDHPSRLRSAFDWFVQESGRLAGSIVERYAKQREDFQHLGLTPAATFAARERTTVAALRHLLTTVGAAAAPAFGESLDRLSHRVFGRPAGHAELHALYLNRMYEPYAGVLVGRDPLELTQRAFRQLGFDLSAIPLDVEERPEKYPGAFCFPVHIPRDVRVSVRVASPLHLLDMLFHEFGHAVHFSGIRADLPVIDRYWIHSGVHETYSTFFELLLGDPEFLGDCLGFDDVAIREFLEFDRFKALLTGTWAVASGLTALEAWTEGLDWPGIEERYSGHLRAFTGIAFPRGFARLYSFVSGVSVYPVGYVMALVRCAHWRQAMRQGLGPRWWERAEASEVFMGYVHPGGAVEFPAEWLDPRPFLEGLGERW